LDSDCDISNVPPIEVVGSIVMNLSPAIVAGGSFADLHRLVLRPCSHLSVWEAMVVSRGEGGFVLCCEW
jgi:hypothetical protein